MGGRDGDFIADFSVIAFTLLCGYSPFRSEDINDLRREMERAKPQFHERYWKNISPQGGRVLNPKANVSYRLYSIPFESGSQSSSNS